MKITIHRGTHEIGGSCVELEANNTRMVIDIGLPLVDEKNAQFNFRPYEKLSGPELIEKKILPNVTSLYRFNQANNPPDALLISHPHLDHFGLLHFVNPRIPLYMSKGARLLIELSYYFNGTKLDFEKMETLTAWKQFKIGDFSITSFLMDHSGFDALAFLIEAEGKRIFYSGDFRGHGRKHIVFDKIIADPPKNIDYLLLEGSHIEEEEGVCEKEEDVESRLVELLKDRNKFYFIATSSQNIDRIVSIYRACVRTNRVFVIDPYTALILEMAKEISHAIPQHDWGENMKVFIVDNRYNKLMQKDNILNRFSKSGIKYEDILKDKGRYLIKDSYATRNKFSADKNLSGSILIYSMWDGYLKDDAELRAFWERNSVPVIHIHTSGHAHLGDLKRFAEALDPKVIMPIHTFSPDKFQEHFPNRVKVCQDGEWVVL